MKQASKSVYEHTTRIRNLINEPKRQQVLLIDLALWNQMCSCLDVIEDTELAIEAYSTKRLVRRDGLKYLNIYGLLQALFLQQDAMRNLCESLGIPMSMEKFLANYPELSDIREIRNDSAGHPTKRGTKMPFSYHYISRSTLNPRGFQLVSFQSNGEFAFKDVSVPDIIADQEKCSSEILLSIINKLEQGEKVG